MYYNRNFAKTGNKIFNLELSVWESTLFKKIRFYCSSIYLYWAMTFEIFNLDFSHVYTLWEEWGLFSIIPKYLTMIMTFDLLLKMNKK